MFSMHSHSLVCGRKGNKKKIKKTRGGEGREGEGWGLPALEGSYSCSHWRTKYSPVSHETFCKAGAASTESGLCSQADRFSNPRNPVLQPWAS
jgi:hypothetical protein